MDNKTITFIGIVVFVFGLIIFISNPWNFKGMPSGLSVLGFILWIIGLYAIYYANK